MLVGRLGYICGRAEKSCKGGGKFILKFSWLMPGQYVLVIRLGFGSKVEKLT